MKEHRTQQLDPSARAEILELYATNYRALDLGRVDEWVATFTVEGVFERKVPSEPSRGTRVEGAEELRRFAEKVSAERGTRYRHWMNNAVFTPGPDSTRVDSYVAFIDVEGPSAPALALTGIYRDVVVETGEGWRFASRQVTVDG